MRKLSLYVCCIVYGLNGSWVLSIILYIRIHAKVIKPIVNHSDEIQIEYVVEI